jgi:ketol-acid reductoisomerase
MIVIIYNKTKDMKKIYLLIIIILFSTTLIFANDKNLKKINKVKSKSTTTEVKKTDDKLKKDMQQSVIEFISDLKANPDSCYIPFKK